MAHYTAQLQRSGERVRFHVAVPKVQVLPRTRWWEHDDVTRICDDVSYVDDTDDGVISADTDVSDICDDVTSIDDDDVTSIDDDDVTSVDDDDVTGVYTLIFFFIDTPIDWLTHPLTY